MLRPSKEVSRAFREVAISSLRVSGVLASFGLLLVHVPSEGGIGGGVDIESVGLSDNIAICDGMGWNESNRIECTNWYSYM